VKNDFRKSFLAHVALRSALFHLIIAAEESMAIALIFPTCAQRITAQDDCKRVRCPNCKNTLDVPVAIDPPPIQRSLSYATSAAPSTASSATAEQDRLPADPWLRRVIPRLTAAGFTLKENVSVGQRCYRLIAQRSRFEVSKVGYAETFSCLASSRRLSGVRWSSS
jgi:hypothetical protein